MMMYDDPDESGDGEDMIVRLLEEIPLLYKARAFADGLGQSAFFTRLGEPLDTRERSLGEAYVSGLGFPHADPALISDWQEAGDAAEALDHDPISWDAEEMLRAGLIEAVLERLDEEALHTAATYLSSKIGELAREAAEAAASYDDIYDEHLINAAAGGLIQAAHNAMLVILAEREDDTPPHPFLARWRLFMRGRWPIGLAGSTYNIL
ncbi:hypothetical protein [Woodsholea maritima]|uniref:hypothetical protein n=1 Tax=Woodsholea maritima TaxID=240237 RepID=UPI00035D82A0|nr:hypothetical protein [Woodsholea maritima]